LPQDPAYSVDTLTARAPGDRAMPLQLVVSDSWEALLAAGGDRLRALAAAADFKAQAGRVLVIPGADGVTERALAGVGDAERFDVMSLRSLPAKLPAGDYAMEGLPMGADPALAATAWGLGAYVFDRYKADLRKPAIERPRLAIGAEVDLAAVQRTVHACALARDMINTPANDMGPLQIETIAREVAEAHGAALTVTTGAALLEAGYPAIHAVGRAAIAERAPRLIEIAWTGPGARPAAPLVVLVGKGVVFDTGGLDIKPSAGMRLMKKDMGGAAHALALARMVMGAGLPIRLVLLLPVVENAISGDAMRPGDVLASRKGLSIEVGNTDAEGRLILADALTRAAELSPDLTIDLATLTGAARVALGPELPPFFTPDETLARELTEASAAVGDPLWRLPLWRGYAEALNSEVADLANDPAAWAQAGAVTAALFLQRFAPETGAWLHLDVYAWNARGRPGWPAGGEAQAIRALDHLLNRRYGT
jgi:leucyl aminopeptidase